MEVIDGDKTNLLSLRYILDKIFLAHETID
jgi:hypothetical protein